MKRQTATTLGRLRLGDRFTLPGEDPQTPRQVISIEGNRIKYIKLTISNQPVKWGRRTRGEDMPVIFIRHTILRTGDECFLQQLDKGDVFMVPGKKREMRIVSKGEHIVTARYVGMTECLHTHPLTSAIFLRKWKPTK